MMELEQDYASDVVEQIIEIATRLGLHGKNAPSIDTYIAKLEMAIAENKESECSCVQSYYESQARLSSDEEFYSEKAIAIEKTRIEQKKKKRRSVCIQRVPSCSSDDDDDDDDIDFNGTKENEVVQEINKEENYELSEDAADDDDSFNAFVSKVKTSSRKKTAVLLSSDDEDGSNSEENSMDDFIVSDGSMPNTPDKQSWRTPKIPEAVISSSEEESYKEDEHFTSRGKKVTKFQTPRIKTPMSSRRHARCTPGILDRVTTPKTPSGSVSYKRDFKKLRDQTAKELLDLFNETVFENKLPDINIVFNKRMTKTAGFCYYYRNQVTKARTAKIELAEKVCDSVERLRDTMIHEMCHAAAWILNGVKCGHGTFWKYWASKAHRAHPDLPPISRCHQFDIECRFNYRCINPFCGKSYGRHSKSLKKCPDCNGSLQLLGKDGITPLKPRVPNKFALYVKENYPPVKADHPNMCHADIMKLLGTKFSMLST
ncbi:germ cell nuclear acidic protein-like isoform X2 [Rhopilema esculentum]|uniref:germ cell nuclear acidic protein-like isoform X2 n=1 Tax=Rhopilema esculentum TaxID=499914 RepID=UPI0031D07816